MCAISIGNESGFLSLVIIGRSYPGAADYWDGNWLDCYAEVACGAFRGKVKGSIRTDELEGFHQQLVRLYERLTGEAELVTMERWLGLRVVGDGRGHLEARGTLRDDPALGNTLDFRLYLDQTQLPPVLQQMAESWSISSGDQPLNAAGVQYQTSNRPGQHP
jgi:hypothetical protein